MLFGKKNEKEETYDFSDIPGELQGEEIPPIEDVFVLEENTEELNKDEVFISEGELNGASADREPETFNTSERFKYAREKNREVQVEIYDNRVTLFYERYLEKERALRAEWKQEIENMKTSELFDIVKNRYRDSVSLDLHAYGEILKDEICKYAEDELKKRAQANQNKKTYYHIFGELICKSFNSNNMFPQEWHRNNSSLVTWIRERYAYLYANLSEDDFKTECQSGLDMIDLDNKLEMKLKATYTSLERKAKNHTKTKNTELEEKMLRLLNEILDVKYTPPYDSSSSASSFSCSLYYSAEEKEKRINQTYKEQHKFMKDEW